MRPLAASRRQGGPARQTDGPGRLPANHVSVPAGMDRPQAVQIEPQRQCPEPVEVRGQFTARHLPHGFGMLVGVLLVVRPEVFVRLLGIGGMESQRVEFVVAHDCKGCPGLDHRPNDLQRLTNLWPAVDEVAEEDGLAFGMLIHALLPRVAQSLQKLLQGVSVAVDVADEVVHVGSRGMAATSAEGIIEPRLYRCWLLRHPIVLLLPMESSCYTAGHSPTCDLPAEGWYSRGLGLPVPETRTVLVRPCEQRRCAAYVAETLFDR